jgi:hypothetical protein
MPIANYFATVTSFHLTSSHISLWVGKDTRFKLLGIREIELLVIKEQKLNSRELTCDHPVFFVPGAIEIMQRIAARNNCTADKRIHGMRSSARSN